MPTIKIEVTGATADQLIQEIAEAVADNRRAGDEISKAVASFVSSEVELALGDEVKRYLADMDVSELVQSALALRNPQGETLLEKTLRQTVGSLLFSAATATPPKERNT